MASILSFVDKINQAINRWRFEHALKSINGTKPIGLGNDLLTVLSMVHHRDVDSYLLAIKSFCRFLHPRSIVVVTDPSITDIDRDKISKHVHGIKFVKAENFREPGLPQGGCWERLIAISEFVQDCYVIQLDADTVALAEMEEVKKSVTELTSFVLATEDGQDFLACENAAEWAKRRAKAGEHVQILCEANLDRIPGAETSRYVRGCAGFSGFAPGSFNRTRLRLLSQTMGALLGDKWSAWGTEQFSSNLMVSNSPRATVLPSQKYCTPVRERPETVFMHFIGYARFTTGRYAQVAREICAALRTV